MFSYIKEILLNELVVAYIAPIFTLLVGTFIIYCIKNIVNRNKHSDRNAEKADAFERKNSKRRRNFFKLFDTFLIIFLTITFILSIITFYYMIQYIHIYDDVNLVMKKLSPFIYTIIGNMLLITIFTVLHSFMSGVVSRRKNKDL